VSVLDKVHFNLPVEEIEGEAYAQIARTASMPFVSRLAVMPDVHAGKGSTVGTVVETQGALMPACVGVDIGCGMIAVQTSLTVAKLLQVPDALKKLRELIEQYVPVGIGGKGINDHYSDTARPHIRMLEEHEARLGRKKDYYTTFGADWRLALGSLGGGNHFIEVCAGTPTMALVDPEGYNDPCVWLTLHSGSRGVGNKLAGHHIRVARTVCKDTLPDPDLAYLSEGTPEYADYLKDLGWAQDFAFRNRIEMMNRVRRALDEVMGRYVPEISRVNCHHNYTEIGKNHTHVTRKGAVSARFGESAMIPGSMGARSYIVVGKGCQEALESAPHGAGRRMSRTKARATFTMDDLTSAMTGVEARVRESIIDEHPNAYKDIDVVMANSQNLVIPTYTLKQLVNVKGD